MSGEQRIADDPSGYDIEIAREKYNAACALGRMTNDEAREQARAALPAHLLSPSELDETR